MQEAIIYQNAVGTEGLAWIILVTLYLKRTSKQASIKGEKITGKVKCMKHKKEERLVRTEWDEWIPRFRKTCLERKSERETDRQRDRQKKQKERNRCVYIEKEKCI